jgi:hypothetical protein
MRSMGGREFGKDEFPQRSFKVSIPSDPADPQGEVDAGYGANSAASCRSQERPLPARKAVNRPVKRALPPWRRFARLAPVT